MRMMFGLEGGFAAAAVFCPADKIRPSGVKVADVAAIVLKNSLLSILVFISRPPLSPITTITDGFVTPGPYAAPGPNIRPL